MTGLINRVVVFKSEFAASCVCCIGWVISVVSNNDIMYAETVSVFNGTKLVHDAIPDSNVPDFFCAPKVDL